MKSLEIIVIDDASTDGSSQLLQRLCAVPIEFASGRCAEIKLITFQKNVGKGHAVRQGINSSTGDVLLIQDADLEYSPEDYPVLLAPILSNKADAVVGSRFTGQQRRVLYFWNSLANKLLCTLTNLVNNTSLTDISSGYKAMRGDIARSLELKSDRFGIEPEIIARLCAARVRLYEVPISYAGRTYYDGKKFRAIDGLRMFAQSLWYGLVDSEPYKPGLMQTLTALDAVSNVIYAPLLRQALSYAPMPAAKNVRVLEIGAGTGSLTKELVDRGHVVATDISDSFVDHLRHRFAGRSDFEVHNWDATKPFLQSEKFDCIVCFNVLEHIDQDRDALRLWSSLLKDTGHIIILVPNGPRLFTPIDTAAGHFRRYSRSELVNKMEKSGLQARKVFYGNVVGMLGWIVNGVILKKSTLPIGQLRLYAFAKHFIGPIERILERYTGLSIVVVASRTTSSSNV